MRHHLWVAALTNASILTWVFLMPMVSVCEGVPRSPQRGTRLPSNGPSTRTPAEHTALDNVRTFGARGDGTTKDTHAVQQAIDSCARSGGGTVYFPAGTYLCGSLHLRSRVTLWIDSGATLKASSANADFDPFEDLGFKNDSDDETSYFHFALLWGEDVENVGIVGRGTIDSNRSDRSGPKTIALKRCKHITIRDITIRNAGNYAISMLGTDVVNINGISIFSSYCDGIDPDCCHDVRISNCVIESWDDAIVPKTSFSLGHRRSTESITVTNCILRTSCNGFKLGTESGGDFKHITVSNCVVTAYQSKVDYRVPTRPISGITLISADGSHIENVVINNIVMDSVRFPIFVRLANRGRDQETPLPGTMKQVIISNVTASDALIGAMIIGHPDRPIEDFLLENIDISCQGGGSMQQSEMDVPAAMKKYPSANKFRGLRTYGLYARHVNGLHLENVLLTVHKADTRHAMIAQDVTDLLIDSFHGPAAEGAAAQLFFHQVRGVLLRGCRPPQGTTVFLEVSGDQSRGISLLGNDLSGVSQRHLLRPGVDAKAVRFKGNL